MVVINYVRDASHASKSARLRCDKCGKTTRAIAVDACKEFDEWDRVTIESTGWTTPIVGRMRRDYCPDCQ